MAVSLFDMLKVGIGPSSSHTVGPMKAAYLFAAALQDAGLLDAVARVQCQLYGSLGATGKGHGSGPAVLLGLEGFLPEEINPAIVVPRSTEICKQSQLMLLGEHSVAFDEASDLIFHRQESLPFHANGMSFSAWSSNGDLLNHRVYYSVGGGFVVDEDAAGADRIVEDTTELPYPFRTGAELLAICESEDLAIADVMFANEQVWRTEDEITDGILKIWEVMKECVQNGIQNEGILPGGLKVKRRAAALYRDLKNRSRMDMITPSLGALDWVNLYALAVNEENAAGGRMVTAPTNGAAGIIPAVLHYYCNFCPNANDEGVIRFLLTAAAIGILFKENASISGAEVGCQGEVGSACAMAAAGLAEATGGTPQQVENAAEIGMEHNLGLTCDPIGGLVQVPCIERNAMASLKAINAAALALRGDGKHFVSLDKVILTMRETGKDMLDKYKETSRGGLAVNIIEC
ncbi:L-serine ammonia-lyase [Dasania sp. GY-MA-18]|uniref:L-serine dehydratase n=1 Tax=Dasania phycosphaerae TaxID=2950436 RepID=A0A9J6RNL8_9GAMM|nr:MULTISPECIES: L-serine ammonia-lyase [Dasania]MCR8923504.1 L-serine ammonia-lyase [Dasania sp. GY-MA-18]MCZ0865938.1 L-serine ammonia-lyase [Dasania phycosphaerae]MCZ0869662.1 L-serine ammonia-lyase [Dasania phycosphaerae]